jgi:hypothetical protein
MPVLSHDDRPPGYGPGATIPDVGFVENPEQILRQQRRQNRIPTTNDDIYSDYVEYSSEHTDPDPHNQSIDHSFYLKESLKSMFELGWPMWPFRRFSSPVIHHLR